MDIERQAGLVGDVAPSLDDLQAPAGLAADLGMGLDAAHDIEVFLGDANRVLDVHAIRTVQVRIKMPLESADEVAGDEAEQPALCRVDEIIAESADRHAAWAALLAQRGDARANAAHVRVEAELSGYVLIDMGMRVNHPRNDELSGYVDCLARRCP